MSNENQSIDVISWDWFLVHNTLKKISSGTKSVKRVIELHTFGEINSLKAIDK